MGTVSLSFLINPHRSSQTIANYLTTKVAPSLNSKHDECLLVEFVHRGFNHMVMNKWYCIFFKMLDEWFIKTMNLQCLNDSGMKIYKEIVFDCVKIEVTAILLKLIRDERDGYLINRDLIQPCIDNYCIHGLDIYQVDFEEPMLEASR